MISPCLHAAVVYESATLGQTGVTAFDLDQVPGINVREFVFPGVRFFVEQTTITSRVGGHFLALEGGGSFFAALIRLEDEMDLPDSDDLSSNDVIASTLLTFPEISEDIYGALEVTLEPGWHALVFGSRLFGADGRGAAISNGRDIGESSYINWEINVPGTGWQETPSIFTNHRFVIEGTIIPEPSNLILAICGIVLLSWHRCR